MSAVCRERPGGSHGATFAPHHLPVGDPRTHVTVVTPGGLPPERRFSLTRDFTAVTLPSVRGRLAITQSGRSRTRCGLSGDGGCEGVEFAVESR